MVEAGGETRGYRTGSRPLRNTRLHKLLMRTTALTTVALGLTLCGIAGAEAQTLDCGAGERTGPGTCSLPAGTYTDTTLSFSYDGADGSDGQDGGDLQVFARGTLASSILTLTSNGGASTGSHKVGSSDVGNDGGNGGLTTLSNTATISGEIRGPSVKVSSTGGDGASAHIDGNGGAGGPIDIDQSGSIAISAIPTQSDVSLVGIQASSIGGKGGGSKGAGGSGGDIVVNLNDSAITVDGMSNGVPAYGILLNSLTGEAGKDGGNSAVGGAITVNSSSEATITVSGVPALALVATSAGGR